MRNLALLATVGIGLVLVFSFTGVIHLNVPDVQITTHGESSDGTTYTETHRLEGFAIEGNFEGSGAGNIDSTAIVSDTAIMSDTAELNIVLQNEGRLTPATVPPNSLVSTWLNTTDRDKTLLLCTNADGCVIKARGDWRSYEYEDGSAVPYEVLVAWIESQMEYFPFATSLVDSAGHTVWTR